MMKRMTERVAASRWMWMSVGLAAGLCISYFWPHEPVLATGNDRDTNFGILTTPVASNVEGVFVLDYLTGQMTGAVLNPSTGQFSHTYARSIAKDFGVDGKAKPHYVFAAGQVALRGNRNVPYPGASVLYVGDKGSGKVVAYSMNFPRKVRQAPTQTFFPFAMYPFGEATSR